LRVVHLVSDAGQERVWSNGGDALAPLVLNANPGASSTRALFETIRGKTALRAQLRGRKDQGLLLWMRVLAAAVRVPASCDRALLTRLEIDDGNNPPVVVEVEGPWSCQLRPDGVVERMRLSVRRES